MKRLIQTGVSACRGPHDPRCGYVGPGCQSCDYREDVVELCDGCEAQTDLTTTTDGERMCAACITEGDQ